MCDLIPKKNYARDFLQELNQGSVVIYKLCGQIVVAPERNVFVLSCDLCPDFFMHMQEFIRHVRRQHNDEYEFEISDENNIDVYGMDEIIGGISLEELIASEEAEWRRRKKLSRMIKSKIMAGVSLEELIEIDAKEWKQRNSRIQIAETKVEAKNCKEKQMQVPQKTKQMLYTNINDKETLNEQIDIDLELDQLLNLELKNITSENVNKINLERIPTGTTFQLQEKISKRSHLEEMKISNENTMVVAANSVLLEGGKSKQTLPGVLSEAESLKNGMNINFESRNFISKIMDKKSVNHLNEVTKDNKVKENNFKGSHVEESEPLSEYMVAGQKHIAVQNKITYQDVPEDTIQMDIDLEDRFFTKNLNRKIGKSIPDDPLAEKQVVNEAKEWKQGNSRIQIETRVEAKNSKENHFQVTQMSPHMFAGEKRASSKNETKQMPYTDINNRETSNEQIDIDLELEQLLKWELNNITSENVNKINLERIPTGTTFQLQEKISKRNHLEEMKISNENTMVAGANSWLLEGEKSKQTLPGVIKEAESLKNDININSESRNFISKIVDKKSVKPLNEVTKNNKEKENNFKGSHVDELETLSEYMVAGQKHIPVQDKKTYQAVPEGTMVSEKFVKQMDIDLEDRFSTKNLHRTIGKSIPEDNLAEKEEVNEAKGWKQGNSRIHIAVSRVEAKNCKEKHFQVPQMSTHMFAGEKRASSKNEKTKQMPYTGVNDKETLNEQIDIDLELDQLLKWELNNITSENVSKINLERIPKGTTFQLKDKISKRSHLEEMKILNENTMVVGANSVLLESEKSKQTQPGVIKDAERLKNEKSVKTLNEVTKNNKLKEKNFKGSHVEESETLREYMLAGQKNISLRDRKTYQAVLEDTKVEQKFVKEMDIDLEDRYLTKNVNRISGKSIPVETLAEKQAVNDNSFTKLQTKTIVQKLPKKEVLTYNRLINSEYECNNSIKNVEQSIISKDSLDFQNSTIAEVSIPMETNTILKFSPIDNITKSMDMSSLEKLTKKNLLVAEINSLGVVNVDSSTLLKKTTESCTTEKSLSIEKPNSAFVAYSSHLKPKNHELSEPKKIIQTSRRNTNKTVTEENNFTPNNIPMITTEVQNDIVGHETERKAIKTCKKISITNQNPSIKIKSENPIKSNSNDNIGNLTKSSQCDKNSEKVMQPKTPLTKSYKDLLSPEEAKFGQKLKVMVKKLSPIPSEKEKNNTNFKDFSSSNSKSVMSTQDFKQIQNKAPPQKSDKIMCNQSTLNAIKTNNLIKVESLTPSVVDMEESSPLKKSYIKINFSEHNLQNIKLNNSVKEKQPMNKEEATQFQTAEKNKNKLISAQRTQKASIDALRNNELKNLTPLNKSNHTMQSNKSRKIQRNELLKRMTRIRKSITHIVNEEKGKANVSLSDTKNLDGPDIINNGINNFAAVKSFKKRNEKVKTEKNVAAHAHNSNACEYMKFEMKPFKSFKEPLPVADVSMVTIDSKIKDESLTPATESSADITMKSVSKPLMKIQSNSVVVNPEKNRVEITNVQIFKSNNLIKVEPLTPFVDFKMPIVSLQKDNKLKEKSQKKLSPQKISKHSNIITPEKINLELSDSDLKEDLTIHKLDINKTYDIFEENVPMTEEDFIKLSQEEPLDTSIVEDLLNQVHAEEKGILSDTLIGDNMKKTIVEASENEWNILNKVGLGFMRMTEIRSLALEENMYSKAKKFAAILCKNSIVWDVKHWKHKIPKERELCFNLIKEEVYNYLGINITVPDAKRILNLVLCWNSKQSNAKFIDKHDIPKTLERFYELFLFLPRIARPTYNCEFCDDQYRSEHSYLVHRCTHTGGMPYNCVFCGYGFMRQAALKKHERLHNETTNTSESIVDEPTLAAKRQHSPDEKYNISKKLRVK